MASVASPRKASKAARPFSCSFVAMTIEISDVRYAADPIAAGEFGTKAFRLCKHSGDHEVYDVIRTHAGVVECSCPDYIARHQGNGHGMCKHGRALVELGLLAAPIAPEFAPPAPPPHVPDEFDEPAPTPAPAPCCAPVEPAPCKACVDACDQAELEDAGPPESWGPETDNWFFNPTDAPAVEAELLDGVREVEASRPTLDLAALVEAQAVSYRAWNLDAGEMIARALDELALKIRMTDATTPAEFDARVEVLDGDVRAQWEARGYDRAMDECGERAACLGSFGHPA